MKTFDEAFAMVTRDGLTDSEAEIVAAEIVASATPFREMVNEASNHPAFVPMIKHLMILVTSGELSLPYALQTCFFNGLTVGLEMNRQDL